MLINNGCRSVFVARALAFRHDEILRFLLPIRPYCALGSNSYPCWFCWLFDWLAVVLLSVELRHFVSYQMMLISAEFLSLWSFLFYFFFLSPSERTNRFSFDETVVECIVDFSVKMLFGEWKPAIRNKTNPSMKWISMYITTSVQLELN